MIQRTAHTHGSKSLRAGGCRECHKNERTSGAVPGPQPALQKCGPDPSSRTSSPPPPSFFFVSRLRRSATFPELPELRYLQPNVFRIIAGQNVTRSDCAQSPKTAHGEKIPSVLAVYLISDTLLTASNSGTFHCFHISSGYPAA